MYLTQKYKGFNATTASRNTNNERKGVGWFTYRTLKSKFKKKAWPSKNDMWIKLRLQGDQWYWTRSTNELSNTVCYLSNISSRSNPQRNGWKPMTRFKIFLSNSQQPVSLFIPSKNDFIINLKVIFQQYEVDRWMQCRHLNVKLQFEPSSNFEEKSRIRM